MNSTTTVRWMPEPHERGTWDLLSSSIFTLIFCAYSVLHLNVLRQTDRRSEKYVSRVNRLKVAWVLVGIFVPEYMLYMASMQYWSARKLTKLVKKHLEKTEGSEGKSKWTLKHSFFAQMGGFLVDTKRDGEQCYIKDSPRFYLTAHGIALLVETGRLPQISKALIEGKSKSHKLCTALASLQGCWLLLQCLGRLIDGLPITLLELHTAAQILCAVGTYLFWLEKPLNVTDPVVLDADDVPSSLIAAMWMFGYKRPSAEHVQQAVPEMESLIILEHSTRHAPSFYQRLEKPSDLKSNVGEIVIEMEQSENKHITSSTKEAGPLDPTPTDSQEYLTVLNYRSGESTTPRETRQVKNGEVLQPFGFGPKESSNVFKSREKDFPSQQNAKELGTFGTRSVQGQFTTEYIDVFHPFVMLTINDETLNRWNLAKESIAEYPDIWTRGKTRVEESKQPTALNLSIELWEYPNDSLQRSYLAFRIPNRSWIDLLSNDDYWHMLSSPLLLSLYGGLHAAAWMAHFPSALEHFAWRSYCAVLACSVLLYLVSQPFQYLAREKSAWWLFVSVPLLVLLFIGAFLHCVTRVCLPVIAFISLRDLPLDAYKTTQWTQYIPHL